MLELKEQTKIMVMFLLFSLLINIVGNSVFIPRMGVQATANTAFISALAYCLLTGIYSIMAIVRSKY
jgi:O-antigen/teichoic acid export membrane protein